VLAGVQIEHATGPVGHSDGDAVLHAVTDALLGAIGSPDIGQQFPDTDVAFEGADSRRFLTAAVEHVEAAGWRVGNVDVTVVCESPRLGPHRAALLEGLAGALNCRKDQVNIKGKTHEGVDAIGAGDAIEVHAVALLARTAEGGTA
jgi:2-C-methyl-D-erythritol 2,4-cyclodiphosphate synthase